MPGGPGWGINDSTYSISAKILCGCSSATVGLSPSFLLSLPCNSIFASCSTTSFFCYRIFFGSNSSFVGLWQSLLISSLFLDSLPLFFGCHCKSFLSSNSFLDSVLLSLIVRISLCQFYLPEHVHHCHPHPHLLICGHW